MYVIIKNMHYIQKHILDELRTAESMRYAQIQPDEIESSHFKYHLNQLIKDGYVEKVSRGTYALSSYGISYVDRLSTGRTIPHESPKVITYTLLEYGDNYYLYKKLNNPYINQYNMLGGRHHRDESARDASSREIRDKCGLEITDQQMLGIYEVIVRKDDLVYTHFIATVFAAQAESEPQGLLAIPKDDLQGSDQLTPDQYPILRAIESGVKTATIEIDL